VPVAVTVETAGIEETLASLRGIDAALRKEANSEIRQAAKLAAEELAVALRAAASSSGVPVAPLVARTIKVKSDRFPTVVIGGTAKVGRNGAAASALLWGSEHGPKGDPNHFAVSPNAGGYWIAPTVKAFELSRAVPAFKRALFEIVRRYGLEP
jgi:hypothetical protein